MNIMRKLINCSWILLLVLSILSACNPGNQPNNQAFPGDQFAPYNNAQTNDNLGELDVPPRRFNITSNNEAQQVAQRLAKLATRIDQVNDATAVVVGRWAIVGIDVNAKLDRTEVGSIKYTVAEALKSDPMGAYAVVTADLDTNYRLREMNKDIQAGEPLEGIMEELAAIVGRLMPQVPRNIEEPEQNQEEQSKRQEELDNM